MIELIEVYDEETDEWEMIQIENGNPSEEKKEKEQPNFCNWIKSKGIYSPAIEVEISSKTEAGAYRINCDNQGQFSIAPQELTADELYLLPESTSDLILKEIQLFWDRKTHYKSFNFIHKRGMLLEGKPGMGKTSIITLLCKDLIEKDGVVFLINTVREFTNAYDFLKDIFRKIEPTRPIVTIIEDVDKLLDSANIEAELLDFLDGKKSIDHHVVLMTANNTTKLPDALLRHSRTDTRIVVGELSDENRKRFFENKGVTPEKIEKFVNVSKGFSFSEMKELFIGTYILGRKIDHVVEYIKKPKVKHNYTSDFEEKSTLGFDV